MKTSDVIPIGLAGLPKLLGVLSGAWTLHILCTLHADGPARFGELFRRLGPVSTKTLTERLRLLEAEGLVDRHYEPTVPPQVTYSLTDKMHELGPILVGLNRIAEKWYGLEPSEELPCPCPGLDQTS